MSRVNPHAAGVDLGAHEIMVCAPGDENTQLVRSFGNYTADLHAIAAWLKEHHIETVAMESTGVYWIPLFETLEAAGFQCCLVSARSLRRIPGRKSDVLDCQWIQTLHSYGLLESSFRPEADLVALRTLLRHRAPHILHMQKALLQMNIQIPQQKTLLPLAGTGAQERNLRRQGAAQRHAQDPQPRWTGLSQSGCNPLLCGNSLRSTFHRLL
jgi:hypothetical protein